MLCGLKYRAASVIGAGFFDNATSPRLCCGSSASGEVARPSAPPTREYPANLISDRFKRFWKPRLERMYWHVGHRSQTEVWSVACPSLTLHGTPRSHERGPVEAILGENHRSLSLRTPRSHERGPVEAAADGAVVTGWGITPRSHERGPVEAASKMAWPPWTGMHSALT